MSKVALTTNINSNWLRSNAVHADRLQCRLQNIEGSQSRKECHSHHGVQLSTGSLLLAASVAC